MLFNAMNEFQVAKREYSEASKEQYSDKQTKDYFRASELGSSDRKIIYGFFKHQIPTVPRSAKSLRTLENGDYVHQRYQKAWEDMGALISMEERLSSKDDEYLKEFEWEWAGHYDGLLDLNILRAHALGLCKIGYSKNEETDQWEMEVEVDDEYAASIGLFADDYQPLTMVADIKTMNPWSFKRIKDKKDVSDQQGYIDQISFYMYMLNTPYGSIYVEDKGSNDVVEIQILWQDMHEGVEYTFDPDIHGELTDNIVRVVINNERFFGSDNVLGLVPRLEHLWTVKKALEEAAENDADMIDVMPPRCSEDASKFPCSWGGGKEKCEFYDHCWNQFTQGIAIKGYEACPADLVWEVTDPESGEVLKVDSRKVPEKIAKEALQALVDMRAIVVERFLVDEAPKPIAEAIEDEADASEIIGANGELNLGTPVNTKIPAEGGAASEDVKPTEAKEYKNSAGKKAIKCLNCGKEITYERLANGGTKKCEFCNHINKVVK